VSDRIPASGRVHWVGTGLSVGSGLRILCDTADEVVVWGRTVDKAGRLLASLGLPGRAGVAAYTTAALADRVGAGDVVVSMLPATGHAELLRVCLDRGAHFACTSYVSPELETLAEQAAQAGTVVYAEAGLDPGIDHVMAHALVGRALSKVGDGPATVHFTSYCGGVPAEPNDFRYRFSWAPAGVLSALRSPARFVDDATVRTVTRPWEATGPHQVDGETFEVYPNRDSLPFVAQYGFPDTWRASTFVRGTLRLAGWRQAWSGVFDVLDSGDPARIGDLAADLAARYPTTEADRDRVVLAVQLRVDGDDGGRFSGRYLLDLVGDERETAMARTVSVPLAYAVLTVLRGEAPAGLRRAGHDPAESQRWLAFLRGHGIDCLLTD
jgi:hypothetical protein